MKNLAILGSTGSIGTQCLDIIEKYPESFSVVALSCHENVDLICDQANRFRPAHVVLGTEKAYAQLKKEGLSYPAKIHFGQEGLLFVAGLETVDTVINGIVGSAGLLPTIEAIKAKKEIAIANKETLVTGGEIIMPLVEEYGVTMLPVDSEHSGVFQILQSTGKNGIDKIILTASGGPFRGTPASTLRNVKAQQALKHPKWEMGKKISIDSATLMNKGLEVIEAHWLFGIPIDKIEVVVHPESVVHAMALYNDGSLLAQMGPTDMRLPILYALTHPKRFSTSLKGFDLTEIGTLHFEKPDWDRFPSLGLAYEAGRKGGTFPTVLNSVNEILVHRFLEGEIGFYDISQGVETAMSIYGETGALTLDNILSTDKEVRSWAKTFMK